MVLAMSAVQFSFLWIDLFVLLLTADFINVGGS